MKIILSQAISLKDMGKGLITMEKEFESDVIPRLGDKITDHVWEDPYEYEVKEVILDYQENKCHVILEMIQFEHNNLKVLENWFKMVKHHDWKPIKVN